jgi:hypothetical protein
LQEPFSDYLLLIYVMKISSTNKLPGFRNRIPVMVLLSASVAVMRCMEKWNPLFFLAGILNTCGMDPICGSTILSKPASLSGEATGRAGEH